VIERLNARRAGGAPLAALQSGRPARRSTGKKQSSAIAVLVAGAVSALILLALADAAVMRLLSGALLLACAAGAGALWWRTRPAHAGAHSPTLAVVGGLDADTLAAFDALVGAHLSVLPPDAARALSRIKSHFFMAQELRAAGVGSGELTADDEAYLREAVRRYVPDALHAYLAIPLAVRSATPAGGESAAVLLSEQLELIESEIDRRMQKLIAGVGDELRQQLRFLEARSKTG
jgi:hypothetical protein